MTTISGRHRGGVRDKVVGAGVAAAAAAAAIYALGGIPSGDEDRDDDNRHRITVEIWSTASHTRVAGSALSNERGTLWRDDLTTGRLHEPFRKNVDVTDDESVTVEVTATIVHENHDSEVSCNIWVDGDNPVGHGGFGDPSNGARFEVGESGFIRCHLNWVGKSLR